MYSHLQHPVPHHWTKTGQPMFVCFTRILILYKCVTVHFQTLCPFIFEKLYHRSFWIHKHHFHFQCSKIVRLHHSRMTGVRNIMSGACYHDSRSHYYVTSLYYITKWWTVVILPPRVWNNNSGYKMLTTNHNNMAGIIYFIGGGVKNLLHGQLLFITIVHLILHLSLSVFSSEPFHRLFISL